MRNTPVARSPWSRLAPVWTIAGIVMVGLALLVVTAVVTAPGFGPVEDHTEHSVDNTTVRAYPVPISYTVATRVEATYEFPQHAGTAMILGCTEYSALIHGEPIASGGSRSSGHSGRLETVVSPDAFTDNGAGRCGFLYVVLQWDLAGQSPAANRPDVQVVTAPVVLPGVVFTVAAVAGLSGVALALFGGTLWARGRAMRRGPTAVDPDESTAETLLLLVDETGDWLARMRRYLIAAGILGVFLWYPLVLPWAWRRFAEGGSGAGSSLLLAAAALLLLLALTTAWTLAYLRLDRHLVAWRERVARFHEREERMLSDLESAG